MPRGDMCYCGAKPQKDCSWTVVFLFGYFDDYLIIFGLFNILFRFTFIRV